MASFTLANPTVSLRAAAPRAGSLRAKNVTVCQAAESSSSGRRAVLAGLMGAASLSMSSSSLAGPIGLKSEQVVVCDPGEEGLQCRRDELAKDDGASKKVNYGDFETRDKGRTGNITGKKSSSDNYEAQTLALIEVVESYMTLSPYDKSRPAMVAQIQKDGNAWVGKFAPGGSANRESSRAFYNALNQLLGHIAFNGLAPMRPQLVELINKNCATTKDFISKGK